MVAAEYGVPRPGWQPILAVWYDQYRDINQRPLITEGEGKVDETTSPRFVARSLPSLASRLSNYISNETLTVTSIHVIQVKPVMIVSQFCTSLMPQDSPVLAPVL